MGLSFFALSFRDVEEMLDHASCPLSALYLLVNIDPEKNPFPSREQELDIHTPDVAAKF